MRLSILGLVTALAGAFTAPAFAQTAASISGSTTFITPAGFTSTVSAESVLPSGFFYNTGVGTITIPAAPNTNVTVTNPAVIVAPSYNVLGFSVATTSVQVATSVAPTAIPVTTATSFNAAAARVLTDAAAATAGALIATDGRNTGTTYFSANIDFIAAIIKAGAGVNGLD
jgi:hypothetical protein